MKRLGTERRSTFSSFNTSTTNMTFLSDNLSSLSLTIHVENMENSSYFCNSVIQVHIMDIPEPPYFIDELNEHEQNFISIPENSPTGMHIGNPLYVIDPDFNETFSFSIQCMNTRLNCPFGISFNDSNSNLVNIIITNETSIDYEINSQWFIRVTVSDKDDLQDQIDLIVLVEDVNESPFFTQSVFHRMGFLPLSRHQTIGLPIPAIDPEHQSLQYSLNSSDFSVDALGQIRLENSSINPWTSHNVTISAIDSYGLVCNASIIISFSGEHSSFSVKHSLYHISELSPPGTTLFPPIMVSGVFTPPIQFELVGTNELIPFEVNRTTGLLSQLLPVDYETKPHHSLTLLVTDYHGQQARGTVDILIEDVNEPPSFTPSSCSMIREIDDQSPVNSFIYPPLQAIDPDHIDVLTYSLLPIHSPEGQEEDLDSILPLAVDPLLGTLFIQNISLLHTIHSITGQSYHSYHYDLLAVVTDQEGLNDTCILHFKIIQHPQTPSFLFIQEHVYVDENTAEDTIIHIPSLIENNLGYMSGLQNQNHSTFIFSIHSPQANCPFRSQGNTSNLIVVGKLDYEEQSVYPIDLCVTNIVGTSCKNVSIHIRDINEPPIFNHSLITNQTILIVDENTPVGTIVTSISAVDPEGEIVYYSILNSRSSQSLFTIHECSGEVILIQPLHYEKIQWSNLTIQASDPLGYSSVHLLSIHVNPVNQAPICEYPSSTLQWPIIQVLETISPNSIITQVNVTDREVRDGTQSLTYTLLSENDTFYIDQNGRIRLQTHLHYGNQSNYLLHIYVQDDGLPSQSTTCSLQIEVIDFNSPPHLTIPSTIIHIPEDHIPFQWINIGLVVEDDDIGQINYFQVLNCSSNSNSNEELTLFGIDPITGYLFHRQYLDYEKEFMYIITIMAGDLSDNPQYDIIQLTILVQDVNESPVLLTHSLTVLETVLPNTVIGIIRYEDPDQGLFGAVQCVKQNSIDIDDIEPFEIINNTCAVVVKNGLDYEEKSEYTLFIQLIDGGGLVTNGTLHIQVTDINEPPNIFGIVSSITLSSPISTNHIIMPSFTVIDPEDDKVEVIAISPLNDYSLQITNDPLLVGYYMTRLIRVNTTHNQTENQNGIIEGDKDLIELTGQYEFTIMAVDERGLQSSISFNITFIPSPPTPIIQPLICSVYENIPINTMIDNCTLHLENAANFLSVLFTLNFTLISMDFEIVQIDNKTASIQVAGEIDYETINQYILPITFTADGQIINIDNIDLNNQITYHSSGQSIVIINVIDVNEPPNILLPSIVIEMDEELPANTTLKPCLQAVDPDWIDRFDIPQFTMQTINPWIDVHSETGCLYLKQNGMDYENETHPKSLTLTVSCSDSHGAFSSQSILVNLKDVNEPPHFIEEAYYFTLTTPFLPHSQVGYPLEVDDSDANSSLSFHIEHQSCVNEFEMNSASPILFTSNKSISEFGLGSTGSTGNHTCIIHISVRDEGGLVDFTIVYVTIITSINPPIITSTTFTIDENPEVGQMVGRLTAISTCSSTNSSIPMWEFHLINSMQLSSYSLYSSYSYSMNPLIIQNSNELVVQQSNVFDFEQRESITIQVMAIDKACYNISSTAIITIQIRDVNEPPIVLDAIYHIPVGTNYPINLTSPIAAVDPEGSPLQFTVLSQSSLISINSNGIITVLNDPLSTLTDISSSNITYRFVFDICVEEMGESSLSSFFTIIIDCDRYPLPSLVDFIPSFIAGEEITFQITETTAVGERVGIPLQVDSGEVVSPLLFFEIMDCQPHCPVTIHPSEGYLTLITPLDFEWISEFTLNVTVTNGLATDSIRIILQIIDESDCSILSIQPSLISPDSNNTLITIRGWNFGLFHQFNYSQSLDYVNNHSSLSIVNGLSLRVDYWIQARLMNERSETIQILLLKDCELVGEDQGMNILDCSLPRVLAHSIQWSIAWNSSIPRSVHHQCLFYTNTNTTSTFTSFFQPINIVDVRNVSQIPTSGATICFDVKHAGSKQLYENELISNRNAISARVIFDNSIYQPLSSCSLNETSMVCCQLEEGIGSIIRWEVCLYGVCDWMEKGMFHKPIITNIIADGTLNVFGGDLIQINGLNFGNREEVLRVYMVDNKTVHQYGNQHGNLIQLNNCHLQFNHTQIQCRSVEGVGKHPLFVVEVANQKSDSFISSVQYQPPVITQISGPGSDRSLTQGGQVIMITGFNLGKEGDQPFVRYGRNGSFPFITSSCHVEIPHTLLRCISVEGDGFQNQWIIEVANQSSIIYTQPHSIYGNPVVTSISPETALLPITGGLSIIITGSNFGNKIDSIRVEYVNEDGIIYLPECTLSIPHIQLTCISLPGYGSQIWWNIQVVDLRADHLFEMKYQQPILSSLNCKLDGCGNVAGGDVVQFHGSNFVPSTASILATYGFTGTEFTATDCVIRSTSLIECKTSPGVGQNLRWIVFLNHIEVEIDINSLITFSYNTTTLSYPSSQSVAMHGRETLIVHLSNDLTICFLCTFQMVMNGVITMARVERTQNSTLAFADTPILHTNLLEVRFLIYYDGRLVETTNSISISTQPPFIQSYMITRETSETSENETVSSNYRISLAGINFGYEQSHITVFIQPKESIQTTNCSIQFTSDELIICQTIYPEGVISVIRSSQESNSIEYVYHTILFNTEDFTTDVDGYLQYPSLFHTVGGDLFHLTGTQIPTESELTITIGSKTCMISHINSTSVCCIVPPGEGIHLPIQVRSHKQILLQLFAGYYPPHITTIQPSILSFDTDFISIEGTEFGTQPVVEIHGILTGKMNCTQIHYAHSHSWIQFHLDRMDPMGLVIAVTSGNQMSNSFIIQTASPFIEKVILEDMNGNEMNAMPIGEDLLVFIQGYNLNGMHVSCKMNGVSLSILYHNSTQMICVLDSLEIDWDFMWESSPERVSFTIITEFHTTNSISLPYTPPILHQISPNEGPTEGGEIVTLEGYNFMCSRKRTGKNDWIHSDRSLILMQIRFGDRFIPDEDILQCNHTFIQIRSPPGQGVDIPVTLYQFNSSSSSSSSSLAIPRFQFNSPFIQSVTTTSKWNSSHLILNDTKLHFNPNSTSSRRYGIQMEQMIFTLRGSNFGIHSTDVWIAGEECAIIYQNHTLIHCLSPLFFGGYYPLIVTVSGQMSNTINHQFPLPIITHISPRILSANGATLQIHGYHIPPITQIGLFLELANHTVTDCHISISSFSAQHFIECHLPTLPRGQWMIRLFTNCGDHSTNITNISSDKHHLQEIEIPSSQNHITLVCPPSFYAEEGSYCTDCPLQSICPENTTYPIASPGTWITTIHDEMNGWKTIVQQCPNPQACLEGNVCREGYQSDRCSQCTNHYVRYGLWTCRKCPSGLARFMPVVGWILVNGLLYLASIQHQSTQFVWYGLLIDLLQLVGLLAIFRDQLSPILAPIVDFASLFLLDMDVFRMECVISGKWLGLEFVPILSIVSCFLIDGLSRISISIWKGSQSSSSTTSSKQTIMHFMNLLYVLILPILYHTLQVFTCGSKYYITRQSDSMLTKCYWQKEYWQIALPFVLILLTAVVLAVIGIQKIGWHSILYPFTSLVENSNLPMNSNTVTFRWDQNPYKWFVHTLLVKGIIAPIVILFKQETHLQSFSLIIILLFVWIWTKRHPPFSTERQYTITSYSRDTIHRRPTTLNSSADYSFLLHIRTDKRRPFHINHLLSGWIIVFALLFLDVIQSPSIYNSSSTQSTLTGWGIMIDSLLGIMVVMGVVLLLLSGCGEILSMQWGRWYWLFDVIKSVNVLKYGDMSVNGGSYEYENQNQHQQQQQQQHEHENRMDEMNVLNNITLSISPIHMYENGYENECCDIDRMELIEESKLVNMDGLSHIFDKKYGVIEDNSIEN